MKSLNIISVAICIVILTAILSACSVKMPVSMELQITRWGISGALNI